MRCQPIHDRPVYIWLKNKQRCLLCDEPADGNIPLCMACETELPWLGEHCQTCALPLPADGLICGQCLSYPPAFDRVIAPWTYNFPIDSLITRFKHSAKWPLGSLLAALLGQALHHRYQDDLERPDVLVPVPLAKRRLRKRGFNQATMLARWLGSSLDLTCDEQVLWRTQDTEAQQELNADARQRNLRHAFALAPEALVSGKHLALVDDVVTTGATAKTLARLLIDAGAARVDVYCLARTPKPGESA